MRTSGGARSARLAFLAHALGRRWHTGLGGHRALGGTQPTQPRVGHSQHSLRKGHTQFGTHRACEYQISYRLAHSYTNQAFTTQPRAHNSDPSSGNSNSWRSDIASISLRSAALYSSAVCTTGSVRLASSAGHELRGQEGAHGLAEGGRAGGAHGGVRRGGRRRLGGRRTG